MAVTYEPIATTTLGSTSTSVVFSSIPQTYTDLVVIFTGLNTTSTNAMTLEVDINGDGGNNYSSTQLYENGSGSVLGGRGTGNNGGFLGLTNKNSSGIATINFMNYSNSTTYKTWLTKFGALGGPEPQTGLAVGQWRNTAAITQLDFNRPVGQAGTFDVGCTFTLYGIKAA
jgi:hypothetical protein